MLPRARLTLTRTPAKGSRALGNVNEMRMVPSPSQTLAPRDPIPALHPHARDNCAGRLTHCITLSRKRQGGSAEETSAAHPLNRRAGPITPAIPISITSRPATTRRVHLGFQSQGRTDRILGRSNGSWPRGSIALPNDDLTRPVPGGPPVVPMVDARVFPSPPPNILPWASVPVPEPLNQ